MCLLYAIPHTNFQLLKLVTVLIIVCKEILRQWVSFSNYICFLFGTEASNVSETKISWNVAAVRSDLIKCLEIKIIETRF